MAAIEALYNPELIVGLLAAVATIAAIITLAMPLLTTDRLASRMKYVASEREKIRRRERARRLELIFVLDDQHVGIVDRAGPDPHEELPWPRHRIVDLGELQRIRSARRAGEQGFHLNSFPRYPRRPRPCASALSKVASGSQRS
jgi:hypothetical protein